jgi:adenylate kinase
MPPSTPPAPISPSPRDRVALIGAPGSGKGTQGKVLAERLRVPYLSTGDLLRDEVARGTDLGRRVAACLDRGELVPDDLMLDALANRLATLRANGDRPGYVLDGFPRTVAQAEAAEQRLPGGLVDHVVFLALPDEVARDRLAHRQDGRRDDDPETIDHRLAVFHAETEPLLDHYRHHGNLHLVDAAQLPAAVLTAIESALDPGP